MKDLSLKARIYVLASILAGSIVLLLNLFAFDERSTWEMLALSLVASLSLIFKVEGSTNRSHYNISFLVYAFSFVVIGAPATMLVILFSNLVEWIWHKYPWYIQSFNIAVYLLSLQGAEVASRVINPPGDLLTLSGVLALLTAMGVFTLINHLGIGLVVWLARGENFSVSGVFTLFPIMLDWILLVMGVSNALVWEQYPLAIILTLLPLYLIFATLKVPALERQSEIDPKTGLFNPKFFDRAIANELNRANRFDRPLTVVMADMDLLRHINNTYGHLAGDEILIGVANIFKQSIREYDVVARFGGEEYVVLMPETAPQQAFFRVEMIREEIERAEFTIPTSVTPIKVTMSFGVAGRESYNQAASDIIHNADAALYHAKLRGRNRTYIYTPDGYENFFKGSAEESAQTGPAAVLETHASDPASYAQPDGIPPMAKTALNEEPASPEAEQTEEVQKTTMKPGKARPKWAVDAYISGLALIAVLLFAWLYRPPAVVDWFGLGIFSVLVILTEWMAVDIYVRNTAVSTSAAPILAGTLLYGPVGALVLSVSFSLVALVKHRSRFNRFIFNASNQMIAGLTYTGLIAFAGSAFTVWPAPVQLLLTVFSAFIVYILTTAPIALAMDLDLGLPFRQVWQEQFSWLAPYYVTMGLIAYAFIFSYQNAGLLGVLVILVPLLLLRLSQKQYIDRTKVIVNELKEKNLKLERNAEEIIRLNEGLLNTLAELIDVRDPYVLGHSKQVAYLSVRIAQKMGLPHKQVDQLRKAGLLHDIGKLGISESILLKPTHLDPDEYDIVRGHAILGSEILKTSHGLSNLVPIVRHHHERFDGSGYPDQLKSNNIPISSRIIAVADAFEAMASDRPYRKALGFDQILAELQRNSGSQFDPLIVKAFIDIIQTEGEKIMINSIGRSTVDTRI